MNQMSQMNQSRTNGSLIGYARVSTTDQDCSIQREALLKAGCTIVREERKSGTTREGRAELDTVLDFLRPGDTLVITRIDRLARNARDLLNIMHGLEDRGVALKAIEQPIDTSTPVGKMFVSLLAIFAEFETGLRRERQMEGIRKAKAKGAYDRHCGKKAVSEENRKEIRRLFNLGNSRAEIARIYGITRKTVYEIAKEGRENAQTLLPAE